MFFYCQVFWISYCDFFLTMKKKHIERIIFQFWLDIIRTLLAKLFWLNLVSSVDLSRKNIKSIQNNNFVEKKFWFESISQISSQIHLTNIWYFVHFSIIFSFQSLRQQLHFCSTIKLLKLEHMVSANISDSKSN